VSRDCVQGGDAVVAFLRILTDGKAAQENRSRKPFRRRLRKVLQGVGGRIERGPAHGQDGPFFFAPRIAMRQRKHPPLVKKAKSPTKVKSAIPLRGGLMALSSGLRGSEARANNVSIGGVQMYRSSFGKRNASDRSCEVAFQSWLSRLIHKCLPRVQSFLKVIAARVSCYKEPQSQLAGYRDIPP
jgi:hypothetical protein